MLLYRDNLRPRPPPCAHLCASLSPRQHRFHRQVPGDSDQHYVTRHYFTTSLRHYGFPTAGDEVATKTPQSERLSQWLYECTDSLSKGSGRLDEELAPGLNAAHNPLQPYSDTETTTLAMSISSHAIPPSLPSFPLPSLPLSSLGEWTTWAWRVG